MSRLLYPALISGPGLPQWTCTETLNFTEAIKLNTSTGCSAEPAILCCDPGGGDGFSDGEIFDGEIFDEEIPSEEEEIQIYTETQTEPAHLTVSDSKGFQSGDSTTPSQPPSSEASQSEDFGTSSEPGVDGADPSEGLDSSEGPEDVVPSEPQVEQQSSLDSPTVDIRKPSQWGPWTKLLTTGSTLLKPFLPLLTLLFMALPFLSTGFFVFRALSLAIVPVFYWVYRQFSSGSSTCSNANQISQLLRLIGTLLLQAVVCFFQQPHAKILLQKFRVHEVAVAGALLVMTISTFYLKLGVLDDLKKCDSSAVGSGGVTKSTVRQRVSGDLRGSSVEEDCKTAIACNEVEESIKTNGSQGSLVNIITVVFDAIRVGCLS